MTQTYNATITGQKPVWSRIANLGSCLNEDITLDIGKDTLTARNVDESHVALWEMVMPSEAFEEYSVDSSYWRQGADTVPLPLEMVRRSLRTMKKRADFQTLRLSTGGIEFESDYQKVWAPSLESTTTPKIPVLDYEGSVTVPTAWLLDALLAAKDYSDLAEFDIQPDSMGNDYFCVSGDSTKESGTMVKHKVTDREHDQLSGANMKSTYAVHWLIPVIRKIKAEKCSTIRLWFNGKYPLKIESEWEDGMTATLFLAPRIDNEG
jgi:DNA polymerase III sliding clamp (beta) subunit (PCNA family)